MTKRRILKGKHTNAKMTSLIGHEYLGIHQDTEQKTSREIIFQLPVLPMQKVKKM